MLNVVGTTALTVILQKRNQGKDLKNLKYYREKIFKIYALKL